MKMFQPNHVSNSTQAQTHAHAQIQDIQKTQKTQNMQTHISKREDNIYTEENDSDARSKQLNKMNSFSSHKKETTNALKLTNSPNTSHRQQNYRSPRHSCKHRQATSQQNAESDTESKPELTSLPMASHLQVTSISDTEVECNTDEFHMHPCRRTRHRTVINDATEHGASPLIPGQSLRQVSRIDEHDGPVNSWAQLDATSFQVRQPGYTYTHCKDNSEPSIFTCQAVDFYQTEAKFCNIARIIRLPGESFMQQRANNCGRPDCPGKPYLPGTFVVHWMFPGYPVENPIWGRVRDDGPGYSIVLYYTLSDYARQEIESVCMHHSDGDHSGCHCVPNEHKLSAGLRLLHRFIENDDDYNVRQRFKAICRIVNVEDVHLNGIVKKLIQSYNGTPFLIKTTSSFSQDECNSYFEIDIDVHRFSYPARMGISGIRETLKSVIFDFAFVIEGHTDDELAERIASSARLSKLNFDASKSIPTCLSRSKP